MNRNNKILYSKLKKLILSNKKPSRKLKNILSQISSPETLPYITAENVAFLDKSSKRHIEKCGSRTLSEEQKEALQILENAFFEKDTRFSA